MRLGVPHDFKDSNTPRERLDSVSWRTYIQFHGRALGNSTGPGHPPTLAAIRKRPACVLDGFHHSHW